MEKHTMKQKPRAFTTTFFHWKELSVSIIQGIVITAGTLFVYQYSIMNGYSESLTRTMTFTVLIAANIFLTLINRSFYYSIFTTLKYKNNLILFIVFITIAITGIIIYVNPLTNLFQFERLNLLQLITCITIGFISVMWFEILKLIRRIKFNNEV